MKRSKNTMMSIVGTFVVAALLMTACTNTPEKAAEKVRKEYREFVEAVEKDAQNDNNRDWDKTQKEYEDFQKSLDKYAEEVGEEADDELDDLDRRYDEARKKHEGKTSMSEAGREALDDFRDFIDSLDNKKEMSKEDIERAYEEKKKEVERNKESLSDEMKDEWRELEERFQKAKEGWKSVGDK